MRIKNHNSILVAGLLFLAVPETRAYFLNSNFETCMHFQDKKYLTSAYTEKIIGCSGLYAYNLFKKNYDRLLKNPQRPTNGVPKIFHHIWLGSEMPKKYKEWAKGIIKLHPNWTYILWTDKEVDGLNLINREFYDEATNYGEKSDIARYEILYRFGGVYLDTDTECTEKTFDELNEAFDFYVAMAPVSKGYFTRVANGVIGACAGHPILAELISSIKDYRKIETQNPVHDVIARTGPGHMLRACVKLIGKTTLNDIVLPSKYFYARERPVPSYAYTIQHYEGSWWKEKPHMTKGHLCEGE